MQSLLFYSITHSDVAVRLDFVDPEAIVHQGASSAEQLLQLTQSEWPHLKHYFTGDQ